MEIYRICLSKHAGALVASGRTARWNSKGFYMVYTAGSVSLACLENLVHRSGTDITKADFSLMDIVVPDDIQVGEIQLSRLQKISRNWYHPDNYSITQQIGDEWLQKGKEGILKVPSAIIPNEWNYLLNPGHPDISKLKIGGKQAFNFDKRLAIGY